MIYTIKYVKTQEIEDIEPETLLWFLYNFINIPKTSSNNYILTTAKYTPLLIVIYTMSRLRDKDQHNLKLLVQEWLFCRIPRSVLIDNNTCIKLYTLILLTFDELF